MERSYRKPLLAAALPAALLAAAALVVGFAGTAAASPATKVAKVKVVNLVVKADDQHAKKGSDGKWHDAFLPANFTVHVGQKVIVHVRNYDGSAHSFHSAGLKVDAIVLPALKNGPATTTFTFTATRKGTFAWHCDPKCDPWAMKHFGFMKGHVKVV